MCIGIDTNAHDMRRNKRYHYICFKRDKEDILLSYTLQEIADYLQLHRNTIRNYLKNSDKYSCGTFIIWKNVGVNKLKTGFALRKPKYIP